MNIEIKFFFNNNQQIFSNLFSINIGQNFQLILIMRHEFLVSVKTNSVAPCQSLNAFLIATLNSTDLFFSHLKSKSFKYRFIRGTVLNIVMSGLAQLGDFILATVCSSISPHFFDFTTRYLLQFCLFNNYGIVNFVIKKKKQNTKIQLFNQYYGFTGEFLEKYFTERDNYIL
ncbi:hypothetical protein BpHYR1_041978 [Brachionus plicatilis]|uniref:Uncharacterized protein n=1 Tax=Brachionus plicatilis TaxID=10195 RepID=A0A3M7R3T0_BRAPC|nr:hypothetical protein BpHYR1_041978 [Brachionus plicatilis]